MTPEFPPSALPSGGLSVAELAPVLLIVGFLALVGIGVFLVAFVHRQTRRMNGRFSERLQPGSWRPERPVWQPIFDAPFRWMAIRGADVNLIQSALRLRNPRPCSWEEGLHRALEHKLFITPPLNGWTLVMGSDLPDPAEDPDEVFHLVRELSSLLGEVHFFSMNRLFSHHSWVLAEGGSIRRGYCWAGQTVWNQGVPTRAELSLNMTTYDYGRGPERGLFSYADPLGATTDKVTALAARWSVDPTTVDMRRLRGSRGITGLFSPRGSR